MAAYIKNPGQPHMETFPSLSFSSRVLTEDHDRYALSLHGPTEGRIPATIHFEKTEAEVLYRAIGSAYGLDEEPAGTMKVDPEAPLPEYTLELQSRDPAGVWVPIGRFEDDENVSAIEQAKAAAFDALTQTEEGRVSALRIVEIHVHSKFDINQRWNRS